MGYKPAKAPFGHTAESGNESAGFSETLKIQYLDLGSIPVISTNSEAESIRALFFIANDEGHGAGPVSKTAGYFPRTRADHKTSVLNAENDLLGRKSARAQGMKLPSQTQKKSLRYGSLYEGMPL